MRFEVLGVLRASGEYGEIALPRGRSSIALSWLLMNAGDVIGVDSLVGVLWDAPPATAQAKTRAIVRELATLFSPGTIETTAAGARISAVKDDIDARHFEQLVHAGRVRLAEGDREVARDVFARALRLWRGDPYPDLRHVLAALPAIHGLVDLRLSAQESLNGLALEQEVAYPLVADLWSQVTVHPERLRLRCQLALALYRVDRQVEALETLRRTRRDLGDAGGQVAELESAILQNSPRLAQGELRRDGTV